MRFAQENRILQGLLLYNNCKITSSKKLMVKFYENSKNSIWENFGHFLPIKGQNVYPNEMKKRKKKKKASELNSVLTYCNLTLEITLDMPCKWSKSNNCIYLYLTTCKKSMSYLSSFLIELTRCFKSLWAFPDHNHLKLLNEFITSINV